MCALTYLHQGFGMVEKAKELAKEHGWFLASQVIITVSKTPIS